MAANAYQNMIRSAITKLVGNGPNYTSTTKIGVYRAKWYRPSLVHYEHILAVLVDFNQLVDVDKRRPEPEGRWQFPGHHVTIRIPECISVTLGYLPDWLGEIQTVDDLKMVVNELLGSDQKELARQLGKVMDILIESPPGEVRRRRKTAPKPTDNLTPGLRKEVELQMVEDHRVGVPGLSECGFDEYEFTDKLENILEADAQREIIAICAIVNQLRERITSLIHTRIDQELAAAYGPNATRPPQ